jgi:hypothetical protein
VLFGGSATLIHGLIPSDIEIRNNLFSKPLTWNPKHPTYAGKQWAIKNLFELKNAQRVTITDNRFENCWVAAQQGYAILLTPRGDQSGGPWVTVANVEFVRNVVSNAAQGISMLGSDDSSQSQVLQNIVIRYTLFDDVATRNTLWGDADGPPRLLSLSPGMSGSANGLTIDHNIATGGAVLLFAEGQHTGLVFTNNLLPNGEFGILANGFEGKAALDSAFPGYVCQQNIIFGAGAEQYPDGNVVLDWPSLPWPVPTTAMPASPLPPAMATPPRRETGRPVPV